VITDNTLAFDDFIGTQYQLANIYAKRAAWVLNRSTLGTCVGLKSATTNTYLLQQNLQLGQPVTILGSPVYEWSDFPAITAATGLTDATMILGYGDFKAGYAIVDRVELYLQRLIEKYAEFGMIGFLARKRVGGVVVLPEAIQLLKNITS
jgi:HK97 family phage major capsid protein